MSAAGDCGALALSGKIRQREAVVDGQKAGLVWRTCGWQHFRGVCVKPLPNGVLLRRRECPRSGKRIMARKMG